MEKYRVNWIAGDTLHLRMRSMIFALLGTVTAAGLGLVAIAANQGWPENFANAIVGPAKTQVAPAQVVSKPPTAGDGAGSRSHHDGRVTNFSSVGGSDVGGPRSPHSSSGGADPGAVAVGPTAAKAPPSATTSPGKAPQSPAAAPPPPAASSPTPTAPPTAPPAPAQPPAAQPSSPPTTSPGNSGSSNGNGKAKGHEKRAASAAAAPVATPPAPTPVPVPSTPGAGPGNGKAKGHGK